MICSVFRRKRKVGKKVIVSRLFWGQYRLDGEPRVTRLPLNTTDRQVAEKMLRKIITELQQAAAGIIAPPALRQAANLLLLDHLDRFIADMETRKNDNVYVYDTGRRIKTLLRECKWHKPGDVTAVSFETWRSRQATGPKTLNDYLASARNLFRWMTKRGLLVADPLVTVTKVKDYGEPRRPRRAFTDDEMKRLLKVAGERGPMYMTLFYTGLRRGEMESLVWGDLALDAPMPFLTVRASASKNRTVAKIPLHPDLADVLRSIRPPDAESDDSVFRRFYRTKRYKEDLKAADIEYRDAQGRYADFHSFRYTTCTNLAKAGVGIRTAMQVMRHSDSRLTTQVYMDIEQLPTTAAIRQLPGLGPLTQGLTQSAGGSGRLPSVRGSEKTTDKSSEPIENKGVLKDFEGNVVQPENG